MAVKKQVSISSKRINQLHDLIKKIKINQDQENWTAIKKSENLQILNEALTHTSANASFNHERLEFLGDAVLRLAASEFIDRRFPHMKVGERSILRAQLVSDRWLTKVGRFIEIHKIMNIGSSAAKDISALETLEAESTEALVGAIYECLNSLEPIHVWLTPFWEDETQEVLRNPNKHNSKSALQEWSQKKGLRIPEYICEETSRKHGDPARFFCKVQLEGKTIANGWGKSRQESEKKAALLALEKLEKEKRRNGSPKY